MGQEFNLKIESGALKENNRKRVHTFNEPSNPTLERLKLQLPVAYEGPKGTHGEKHYTPEHYFIAAISGCFFTTFSVVSSNSNMEYNSLTIEAKGVVGTSTGEKIMEKIEQKITLKILNTVREKKAQRVSEITENRCPLAKSVKTKVINTYKVISEQDSHLE